MLTIQLEDQLSSYLKISLHTLLLYKNT
jgi:hypothetical protein